MCEKRNLKGIMGFKHDWNEEVIAQFYSTLWVDMTYTQFAGILGFDSSDLRKHKIHNDLLNDSEMAFMYDSRFGDIRYGTTHGLHPYYKCFNNLFRCTMAPKSGDSSSLLNMARNLLDWMSESHKNNFSVFSFIWNEILINSQSTLRSCGYAPYIMQMIEKVTNTTFLTDVQHPPYGMKKHKDLHLPDNLFGESSSPHPSARASAPSLGPKPTCPKTGTSTDRPLKSIFNVCKSNATEINEQRRLFQEAFRKIEQRQQKICRKLGVPSSPLSDYPDIPPPPVFYDPWAPYTKATAIVDGDGEEGDDDDDNFEDTDDDDNFEDTEYDGED
ncbi:hypothetical protein ACP4OV_026298 [Aristida adscensionis]